MDQERAIVFEKDSFVCEQSRLVLSATRISSSVGEIDVVVGRPGLPNITTRSGVGGAILYESPEGLFEVRVLTISPGKAELLVTQVTAKPGIIAGFVEQDQSNTRFEPDELRDIADGLERIRALLSSRSDIAPEQMELISRKLDELRDGSERFGRRDWLNIVVGTLTSAIFAAALKTSAAKALFAAAQEALGWLFASGLRFLP